MRLETENRKFVAEVEPMLPLDPNPIAVWGDRVFLRVGDSDVWRETMVTVVFARNELPRFHSQR